MLGKKTLIAGLLVAAGFSNAAYADGNTVLGAVIGGALGASIGHSVGGRNASVIGGVLGAAAGASIADAERERYYAAPEPYYRTPRGQAVVVEGPDRYYAPPVAYAPTPVVYEPAPVLYAPRPAVYVSGGGYREQEYRPRHDRGWERHHRDRNRDDCGEAGQHARHGDGYYEDRGFRGR